MIHVCSLARLHDTVAETRATHIVTLLRLIDRVQRPTSIVEANHLVLGMDDIMTPRTNQSRANALNRSRNRFSAVPADHGVR